jgi:hypothetical protein
VLFDTMGFFGHLGLAMYTFDANVVVLNVKAEAKNQRSYYKLFLTALIFSITLFNVFASVCYYAFREDAKDMFTLSLPLSVFTVIIKLGVCINALFSYPL